MGPGRWVPYPASDKTARAVWVGIGAVLTVAFAMATGAESINPFKVVCLVMIVGGVDGLKLAH